MGDQLTAFAVSAIPISTRNFPQQRFSLDPGIARKHFTLAGGNHVDPVARHVALDWLTAGASIRQIQKRHGNSPEQGQRRPLQQTDAPPSAASPFNHTSPPMQLNTLGVRSEIIDLTRKRVISSGGIGRRHFRTVKSEVSVTGV